MWDGHALKIWRDQRDGAYPNVVRLANKKRGELAPQLYGAKAIGRNCRRRERGGGRIHECRERGVLEWRNMSDVFKPRSSSSTATAP